MSSPLVPFLVQYYAQVKQTYPTEGRRRWRLRITQQFWNATGLCQQDILPGTTSIVDSDIDSDPLDVITRDEPELGLIVRTDFSDEPAWLAFCARLQDSEKELVSENDTPRQPQPESIAGEWDDSGSDSDATPAIFHVVNPSSSQEREIFTGASNLTILRMFNDVDIRPSPTPPHGIKRINPQNRLVDKYGWQEFYRGKNVWIYDTKSNTDQCVRVVSQSGDMYGTATGDSWRARVSHICEIQVSLSSGAIKIDFGGLDRWDFAERSRNMMEAEGQ